MSKYVYVCTMSVLLLFVYYFLTYSLCVNTLDNEAPSDSDFCSKIFLCDVRV